MRSTIITVGVASVGGDVAHTGGPIPGSTARHIDGAGSTHELLDWLTARHLSYSAVFDPALPRRSSADLSDVPESATTTPCDTLRVVLLTHWHPDHTGSAAEIGTGPGVRVWAHHADAPVIRGHRPGPPPVLTPAEETLYPQIAGPARCATGTGGQ